MMFFTLEFIGLSNIRVHVRIFREMRNTFIDTHRSLVNSQRSDQPDHDTRIRYPGWAASKQSLQAPLPFFLPQVTLGLLRSLSSRDSYHLLYFPGAHLSDLLSQSDFIVLCTPLTSETSHMISAKELALMKPIATLVNIARGGIVNHDDLTDALKNGVIKAAALDVTEPRPVPKIIRC